MSNNTITIEQDDGAMLIKIISEILSRGNDAEIKQSKNGIKVLEVGKKLRVEINNK